MLRSILVYGAVSGTVVILGMIAGMMMSDGMGSQAAGYLIMFIALSVIFIGIKRHRDLRLGGVIKFLPAFGMGLGIAVVAGLAYVVTWEIYLAITDYAFMEQYIAASIEARQSAGMSGEELQAYIAQMDQMRDQYANPVFRLPITFLEIFPIGLVIALVSAILLRNPRFLPHRPTV
ncbi:DUF4199 domain-containing protein [Hyphobacterium marinum]|uniref:DUF4199 domain-containing protein n=1 Tax=Hyphobacterium marinum TaxID=3116574 RepID=A0ABU7LYD2_9PROT|nr:DUF4199 domain-containing protein [Hyphobacterium sp. Y6023]MEE2566556.1 DUF4199 domain-containing protein [Hyphobacterium sp. Y6023]